MMRAEVLWGCSLLVFVGHLNGAPPGIPGPTTKKLIEYGWDVPTPRYVADHIREMEQRPFDGVMMYVPAIRDVFATQDLDEAALNVEMEALQRIRWGRFTDNFLMVLARSEMDWFSDEDWEWVLRNVGLAAQAARLGGCKGLTFDCEPYGADPWDYRKQKYAAEKSFPEYQAQVRQRGTEFIARIQEEFPHPVIHTFYLLALYNHPNRGTIASEPDPVAREKKMRDSLWPLYPAFVNGMLDGARPGTVITDGNEDAYWYTRARDFYESYHTIHQTSLNLVFPSLHAKYRAQIECAQALFADYIFGLTKGRSLAQYMTAQDRARWFEHNVYYALQTSDRYVWLYSENMNWWAGVGLPAGIEEAVVSARDQVARKAELGIDLEAIMRRAEGAMKEDS